MPFARDLLEQGWHLARLEPNRPRQVSLRRAVSAAYYSLFHHLIDEACRFLVSGRSRRELRRRLSRSFDHRRFRTASRVFSSGRSQGWGKAVESVPQPLSELGRIANRLQEARHGADYDRSVTFTRTEAIAFLLDAEKALSSWDQVRNTRAAEAFLLAMLVDTRG